MQSQHPSRRARLAQTAVVSLLGAFSTMTHAATAADTVIRVNVGGGAYTDSSSNVWQADTGFNIGSPLTVSNAIAGTSDPGLFRSYRYDAGATSELVYRFAVPSGTYEVKLYFAETYTGAFNTGNRVFNVLMEDTTVFANLDVYAQAGANTALIKSATVEVSDGTLDIDFLRISQDPMLAAIEIIGQATADAEVPTTVAGFRTLVLSSSRVDLAWSASSDNVAVASYIVQRCLGATCTQFTEIANVTTTSYRDIGRAAGTTYRYRVRAKDTAGNVSAPSSTATITTIASDAPTKPANLTGTAVGPTQIDLAWDAASDAKGVTGYSVERCSGSLCYKLLAQTMVTATSFSDTTVKAGTSNRYRVRALDADGNFSAYSPTITVVTPATPATNAAPSIGGTPTTTATTGQAYSFRPSANDADGDALGFSIQNKPSWATFNTSNGSLSGTPPAAGTFSSILISVSDGESSVALPAFSIVVSNPPPPPATTVTLTWTPPTTNTDGSTLTDLAGYRIVYGTSANAMNTTVPVSAGLATYVITDMAPGTYYFAIKSYNQSGTESALSNIQSKTLQ